MTILNITTAQPNGLLDFASPGDTYDIKALVNFGTSPAFAALQQDNGAVSVINENTIDGGTVGFGIDLVKGGTVTNNGTAKIAGAFGVVLQGTSVAHTLINSGTLIGSVSAAALLTHGGSVTNNGQITASGDGVLMQGGTADTANVLNSGTIIAGINGTAVDLFDGGNVTNTAGTLSGQFGVAIQGGPGTNTVVNSAVITGTTGSGVFLSGGTVTNNASGQITGNFGVAVGIDTGTGSVVAAGTLENAGTITGTGGTAVALPAGFANSLKVDPGAVFSGVANGGNTPGGSIVSTLELAVGGSQGTLSGLGSQFIGFGNVTVDAGASWALAGLAPIAASQTLTNLGTLTIGAAIGDPAVVTIGTLGKLSGAGGLINVGGTGTGSLLVQNHATVITGASTLAVGIDIGAAAAGAVTVSGTNSLLGDTGEFIVGDTAPGSLAIQSGGTVTTALGAATTGVVISNQSGGAGSSVNVSGSGSNWQVAGSLVVGNAGVGSLNIAAGGFVTATAVSLAASSGGNGLISVVGTSSSLTVGGSLSVGGQGAGGLSIFGGATVTAQSVTIGSSNAASSGNVDVEGTGSELIVTGGGTLNVGFASGGSGLLTIGNGTSLHYVGGTIVVAGHGSFNNNGGAIDPDAVAFSSSNNSAAGTNLYNLYVGNTGAVQINTGTGTWTTPMILTGTSTSNAIANIGSGTVGQWQLSNGGTLIVNANTVDAGQAIVFEDSAADTLVIGQVVNSGSAGVTNVLPTITAGAPNLLQSGGFSAGIWGFQAGDKLQFTNMTVTSSSIVNGNTVNLFNGSTPLGSLTFFSKVGSVNAAADTAAAAAQTLLCYRAGTRIRTPSGDVAIEDLRVGDMVETLLGQTSQPIAWIGRRAVDCRRHPRPEQVLPVRVNAGAFGPGLPFRDLYLSPNHAVYVSGQLIPIKCLINGRSISQVPVDEVTYYHVELPKHDLLLAEGLPAESYLDTGDRGNFENGGASVQLFPDFSVTTRDVAMAWEARGCAPLVISGPELEAVRDQVNRRAAWEVRVAKAEQRQAKTIFPVVPVRQQVSVWGRR